MTDMTDIRASASDSVRKRLKNGGFVVGFNVFESLRPSVVKVLAQVGYDVVLVETEHILHDPENLTTFLVMSRDNGLCPIVTIPSVSRAFVSGVLDAGAMGICLCHAETAAQVEDLVRWMKYPPAGERALAHGPGAQYTIADAAQHCQQANDAAVVVLKIESRKGIENAAEMLSNEWVDGVVFGPGDLCADMGLHGKWDHPDVIGAMEGVVEIALARGVAVEAVALASDRAEFERQRERGIQIFGPIRSTEYDALRSAATKLMEPFR